MWLLTLISKRKYIIYISAFFAVVSVVYLWRAEIIKSAENAYKASITQMSLDVNIESRKKADEVKKIEQSKSNTDIDRSLCDLGIMRGNEGC